MNQPNDIKLEAKVIGTLLLNPDLYVESNGLITPETFYNPECRVVYTALETLSLQGRLVSLESISQEIKRSKEVADVYLMTKGGSTSRTFAQDCLMLRQVEIQREQLKLGYELCAYAIDEAVDPLETNDKLLSETERIVGLTDMSKPKTNAELIKALTTRMEKANQTDGITGIKTGYKMLDLIYGGRQPSHLIIKAGRPAMGKTANALCEAYHMAYDYKYNVAFFSLEMSAEELMQRLVSVHTEIPLNELRSGKLQTHHCEQYNTKTNGLLSEHLTIIDDIYSLSGIRTRAKKMKMRGKLDVVFIDYIGLVQHSVAKGRSRENEVSEISRTLKMMAKDLEVPVIALSQLSRKCEERSDKKPMLSDLRESGAIEQDADVVEFMYRPEYYEEGKDVGKAFVIIAKNRHGSIKDVEFDFHAECTKFNDPDRSLPPPPQPENQLIKDQYGDYF